MARGQSTKIVSMIKRIQTSRLEATTSLSAPDYEPAADKPPSDYEPLSDEAGRERGGGGFGGRALKPKKHAELVG